MTLGAITVERAAPADPGEFSACGHLGAARGAGFDLRALAHRRAPTAMLWDRRRCGQLAGDRRRGRLEPEHSAVFRHGDGCAARRGRAPVATLVTPCVAAGHTTQWWKSANWHRFTLDTELYRREAERIAAASPASRERQEQRKQCASIGRAIPSPGAEANSMRQTRYVRTVTAAARILARHHGARNG